MQLTTILLGALSAAGLASAQKTWVVAVAQDGGLTYSPEKITAQPGEYIQFQFHAGNHTVTQSTFDAPCQPAAAHSNATGFHSGFVPAAASVEQGMFPTFTIQVNNTAPLWLYCAQGKHCENGMVMVVNEPTNPARTLENYKAAAAKAQTVVPGGTGEDGAAGGDSNTGGGGAAGGQTGSTPTASGGAVTATPAPGAAGMLAAPGMVALVAAAGAALLF
ncbi:hypothetical protein N0V88_000655 [Collariella sp. IMI 366227]|nr:hypothetical protein N0V88_000655 [Collariella sp. IMI 366227]